MSVRERVLELLLEGKRTQREVSLALGTSRSRISEVLTTLEKETFVRREKVSNRTVLVSINREKLLRIGMLKSSEYAAVVLALKEIEKKVISKIVLYDNSLEALRDLLLGNVDLVASPLISSYFFYLIDNSLKPIAGIAQGGSGILRRKNRGLLGTTPISSMERESRERKNYRLVYFKSIEDMLAAYRREEVDAISLWEPFLTVYKGEKHVNNEECCVLVNRGDPTDSIRIFLGIYKKIAISMNSERNRTDASDILSGILNFPKNEILTSLDSYIFSAKIDENDLRNQIRMMGLPEDTNVEKFLERYNGFPVR